MTFSKPLLIPGSNPKILKKLGQYIQYHGLSEYITPSGETRDSTDIEPWDIEFCNVDQNTLFELILVRKKGKFYFF